MIFLKAQGRLGNQLFQYAFVKYLSKQYNQKICINFERVRKKSKKKGDGWENGLKYFNIYDYEEIYYSQYQYMWVWIKLKLVRFLINSVKNNDQHGEKFGVIYCYEPKNQHFQYINRNNIIVDGLFEYSYIVDDVIDELRKELFKYNFATEKNNELYKKILLDNSICVTVRKFDMEDPKFTDFYQKCSVEYYHRGIQYIINKYPNANIIVFSDQIDWCKNNLKLEDKFPDIDITYETHNNELNEKMQMMSKCSHYVISNSTFSWWVQKLSQRKGKEKIVCAPIRWNDKYLTKDIGLYCPEWILLEN